MKEVICKDCGDEAEKATSTHTNIEYWVCHNCQKTIGRVTEVYSRPCGYLSPVRQWNKGKSQEFKTRKTYKVNEKSESV